VGVSWNCKENNMKNKCIVKKAFFKFENPVPLNMRLRMQPRLLVELSLLTKWPVFLQNASGNPIFNRSGSKRAAPPNWQSIPPKPSCSLSMKSFFNSLYVITKPQKKLKATHNAVDLAIDLLLSSQSRKHRGESNYHQFKTTNLRQHHCHQ